MADPVSWLQIAQGWRVVASDGGVVGTVAQIEGDQQNDIFDGLAVASGGSSAHLLYVPAEKVGLIYPGEVTLNVASSETPALEPFQPPPPETTWRPGRPPLSRRLSNWLRGSR